MKQIIIGLLLMLAVGCSTKYYYLISVPHQINKADHIKQKTIGIETIEIPSYLSQGKVAVLQEKNRIVYLDSALWAVDMREDLTKALIFDLQKSLKKSRVFHYPWDGADKIDFIIRVKINRFIAYKGYVYLDAVIRIKQQEKVISLKIPTNMNNPSQIVKSMQKAFFALEHEVIVFLDDIDVS